MCTKEVPQHVLLLVKELDWDGVQACLPAGDLDRHRRLVMEPACSLNRVWSRIIDGPRPGPKWP